MVEKHGVLEILLQPLRQNLGGSSHGRLRHLNKGRFPRSKNAGHLPHVVGKKAVAVWGN